MLMFLSQNKLYIVLLTQQKKLKRNSYKLDIQFVKIFKPRKKFQLFKDWIKLKKIQQRKKYFGEKIKEILFKEKSGQLFELLKSFDAKT